jgi:hypothetical protein
MEAQEGKTELVEQQELLEVEEAVLNMPIQEQEEMASA